MKRKARLIALGTLLLAFPLHAAKVVPAYETERLPDEADEVQLWERASSHENRLRNAGTIFHDRHMEAYIEEELARIREHVGGLFAYDSVRRASVLVLHMNKVVHTCVRDDGRCLARSW